MAAGDIETYRRDDIWFNRIEGEARALGTGFETEEQAVKVGRSAAMTRQVAHSVRDEEGPSPDESAFDRHPRDITG